MGYPTIDKFDIKFIERTKANIKTFNKPNKFTHLINSLIGLIFIPNEFNKKGKRKYKIDFLNKPIADYKQIVEIFSGKENLTDEQHNVFVQKKFFCKDNNNIQQSIETTTVGNLLRLFRNGIAHQNITPVAEGDYWKGIIVRNYKNRDDEKNGNFNFESYLNQKELRLFATFIADEYIRNIKS